MPKTFIRTCVLLSAVLLLASGTRAADVALSRGQTVYVPVYANVFTAPRALPFQLSAILSLRNTDPAREIELLAADYYDTDGRLIHKYFTAPKKLRPLESTHIFLPEQSAGGVGANFLVRWRAATEVNPPIIECIMIGASSGQGISFVSPGQVLHVAEP